MQHPDEGTIHAWLDGALPTPEARALEEHVAGCAACAAAVAEARGLLAASSRILSALDSVPGGVLPAASPETRPGALGIAGVTRGRTAPSRWRATPWRAAAAIVLVGSVSWLATRPGVQKDAAVQGSSTRDTIAQAAEVRGGSTPDTMAQAGAALESTVAPTASAPSAAADRGRSAATAAARESVQAPPAASPRAKVLAQAAPPGVTTAQAGVTSSGFERAATSRAGAADAFGAPAAGMVVGTLRGVPAGTGASSRSNANVADQMRQEPERELRRDSLVLGAVASRSKAAAPNAAAAERKATLPPTIVMQSAPRTPMATAPTSAAPMARLMSGTDALERFVGCYTLSTPAVPNDASGESPGALRLPRHIELLADRAQ